eukprot:Lankesteria_metandrocarpae@DN2352_c0_g1_i1.p1
MAVAIIPYIHALSFVAQVLYPLSVTVSTVLEKSTSYPEVVQWSMYWIIYSLWNAVQNNLLFFVADYCPLFYEMKLLVFFWLVHPEFKGAGWLWFSVLQDPARIADTKAMEQLDLGLGKFLSVVQSSDPVTATATTAPVLKVDQFKATRDSAESDSATVSAADQSVTAH